MDNSLAIFEAQTALKLKRRCHNPECREFISRGNKSGLCLKCSRRAHFLSRPPCKKCGKPTTTYPGLALCNTCYGRQDRIKRRQAKYARVNWRSPRLEIKREQAEADKQNGKRIYERRCWGIRCKRIFTTTNPFERYHSEACRSQALASDAGQAYRNAQRYGTLGTGRRFMGAE